MNILKKLAAITLAISLLGTLMVGCGDDKVADSSDDTSLDSSSAEGSATEAASSEESLASAESSESVETEETTLDSHESSETSVAESSATTVDSSEADAPSKAPEVESKEPPKQDDSSVAPPKDDSSVAPPKQDESSAAPPKQDDNSVAPPKQDDSSAAPPVESTVSDDSSVEPPKQDESSVSPAKPDDSSVAPPEDSSEEASSTDSSVSESSVPDDSSEESSEISVDPYTPLNPLPDTLYADPIDSFFDNSVFIGYSITMHFGRYVGQWRQEIDSSIMGNAIFCAAVGISFNADATQTPDTPNTTLPLFRGEHYNFADLPAATGSDTMYIGLTPYSDLKWAGSASSAVDEAYRSTVNGLRRIMSKNPNLKIVVLAGTYNSGTYDQLSYNWQSNAQVYEYNNRVLDFCTANGIDFVDVATPLTDHRGYFVEDYASDGEYHIIKQAYYLWMEALRDYATKKTNGTWQNPVDMPYLPLLG